MAYYSYACVTPGTGIVDNTIVWDGVTPVHGVVDYYVMILMDGRPDIVYIGGRYDFDEDKFYPPE